MSWRLIEYSRTNAEQKCLALPRVRIDQTQRSQSKSAFDLPTYGSNFETYITLALSHVHSILHEKGGKKLACGVKNFCMLMHTKSKWIVSWWLLRPRNDHTSIRILYRFTIWCIFSCHRRNSIGAMIFDCVTCRMFFDSTTCIK